MANTIRIKRRAAGGAAGAPSTLENGELAFNEVDLTLYYGQGTGGAGGSATAILAIGGTGAFISLTGAQTISGNKTFTGIVDASGASSVAVPTVAGADNSTKAASTAWVRGFAQPILGFTPENPANKGQANGYASLGADGLVPTSQLPSSVTGGMNYQGTWNASTNSPTLADGSGVKGAYYKVSVAGNTTIGGNNNWTVGDLIVYNGATWDKFEGGSPDVVSVAGRIGAVTLAYADISGLGNMAQQTASAVAITGGTLSGVTVTGSLTGNASTATTLATARTIALSGAATGTATSFNGSANITIAVTALDVGNAGVAGTLAVANGGTGSASYTIGDIIQASAATTLSKLAAVAVGNVLISGGVGTVSSWGKVGLTTHVTGTLPVANGGTGTTTSTGTGSVVLSVSPTFTGTAGFASITATSISGPLTGNVTGNVSGTALNVTGVVAAVNGGTGQSSYAVGDLLYAATTTTIGKLADIATGNVLISGGVGAAPSYGKVGLTTHVSGTLPVANGGTGAATLTGYLVGNGTGAFTAVATLPNTAISGLGTMSVQNASAVAITGGTIDGITLDGGTF